MNKKEQKNEQSEIRSAALTGGASEVVERYGSGIKEHLVAYEGVDNEIGQKLKKGLESISKSKISKKCAESNIKQQSGYAAEVKYVARENAKSIIEKKSTRVTRTDDLGRVNDPIYDHETIYNGVVVQGGGEQMKFIGKNPEECLKGLLKAKCEKYLEKDATITVPSDYYEGVLTEADAQLEKLARQLERAQKAGKEDLVLKKTHKIWKIKKIKQNLKNSGVSSSEAKEARLNPQLSTGKDIARIAHSAGVEQAKLGGAIAGVFSIVTNCISVINGEKDAETAGWDVVKDTGTGAALSYATAFSGSIIKGTLQNGSNTAQAISKTNLPAIVVTSALSIGKTLQRYITGQIDGVQCLEELGQKGTCQISSALFTIVGKSLTASVVGGIAGSMFGYALASSCYKTLKDSLKDAKIAREIRIQVERECEEAIKHINAFHETINRQIQHYLSDHQQTFDEALFQLSVATETGNVDSFIVAANKITIKMGKEVPFQSAEEFDILMLDSNYTFKH